MVLKGTVRGGQWALSESATCRSSRWTARCARRWSAAGGRERRGRRAQPSARTALAYAEAITWHLDTDDAFWERLRSHFSEPELVKLGCMIGLTLRQQSWLRLLTSSTMRCWPAPRRRWHPVSKMLMR
jgi:alkylhydroperoxidase family enzyme